MRAVRPQVALDQPIRNSRRVWFCAGFSWLFGAFMLCIGVLIAVRSAHEGVAAAVGGVAFGVVIALPAFWYGTRIREAQLRITDRSVVVRNPIRAVTAPLDEAAEFVPGNVTPHGNNGTPGIVLRLQSGRELPVWALAEESTIFSAKRKTASFGPLAADLNALLASARAARG